MLVMVMLLTACTGSGEPVSSDPGSENTGTSSNEGRTDLNLQLYAEPTHLDPHYSTSTYDMAVMYQIYDNLFEIVDGDYDNPQPSL